MPPFGVETKADLHVTGLGAGWRRSEAVEVLKHRFACRVHDFDKSTREEPWPAAEVGEVDRAGIVLHARAAHVGLKGIGDELLLADRLVGRKLAAQARSAGSLGQCRLAHFGRQSKPPGDGADDEQTIASHTGTSLPKRQVNCNCGGYL